MKGRQATKVLPAKLGKVLPLFFVLLSVPLSRFPSTCQAFCNLRELQVKREDLPSFPRKHRRKCRSELRVDADPVPQAISTSALDWTFLDAAYVITCPNADEGSKRLSQTKSIIGDVGITQSGIEVSIKEFQTDDEDRVRGCYTSHIAVLQDAKRRWKNNNKQYKVLVVEDNLATSTEKGTGLTQAMLDEWRSFIDANADSCDVVHLAYTPYIPNLTVLPTVNPNIKQLKCGIGSALGTSAYIITSNGVDKLLREHDRVGYVKSIPDAMASLYPETRYATYPAPFQRAPKVKSLVNPQLDELREILFQPFVVARAQDLLVLTAVSTNTVLPALVAVLLVMSGLAGKTTFDAAVEWSITGSYQGNAVIPVLSSIFSLFSLGVLGVGAALAPKPTESVSNPEEPVIWNEENGTC